MLSQTANKIKRKTFVKADMPKIINNEEKQRILWWMSRLNKYTPGWEIGDKKGHGPKTADFINHSIQIAIELKREKGGSLDNQSNNLLTLSNRLEPKIKDANEKFKQYQKYKTILILELDSDIISAQVVMSGLPSLHFYNGNLVSKSIRNKKLYSGVKLEWDNIGSIILWPSITNNFNGKAFYFNNPSANPDKRISLSTAEKIISKEMEILSVL